MTPERSAELAQVLAELTPRQEQVLRMRLAFGEQRYTLEEVGQRFAVSKERIRQIEHKALRLLPAWANAALHEHFRQHRDTKGAEA